VRPQDSEHSGSPRSLSEREVAAALGIEPLEVYLLAAGLRVGRFDSLTHLLVLTPGEVERMAARLGVPCPDWGARLEDESNRAVGQVPEPEKE
jgi:N-acyl-L-homoserine lactone synthetase